MAFEQRPLREMALFAGAGGGILGGILLGWETICAVEINAFCARRLAQRQNEGHLPPFPIWDDVSTFDGYPWRGRVDVVSGGFPCQDISVAGKGSGITGQRSGLWKQMARVVREVRPRFVFVENSPALVIRGLGVVLRDLAEMGYDARWGVFSAADIGAPHLRERIFVLADAGHLRGRDRAKSGEQKSTAITGCRKVSDADSDGLEGNEPIASHCAAVQSQGSKQKTHSDIGESNVPDSASERQSRQGARWYASDPSEAREGETAIAWAKRVGIIWGAESPVGRVANGVAARMDRLRAIGNGQVPAVVKLAWETLVA